MNYRQLKVLVTMYRQTKDELDKLLETRLECGIKSNLLAKLNPQIGQKYKNSDEGRIIFESLFFPEENENNKKDREASSELIKDGTRRKIEYLELKLKLIEEELGDDLKELERNERESILKRGGMVN